MSELAAIKDTLKGLSTVDRNVNRESILRYEKHAKELPQVQIDPTHLVAGGMYARNITIPKGTVITGQIYKYDHIDIMVSGHIIVSTDMGEIKELSGFNMFPSNSGKKRAGYALEDTVWVTLHSVPPEIGTDGEEIQKALTVEDFKELENFYAVASNCDYFNMLREMGLTDEEVRKESHDPDNYIEIELVGAHIGKSAYEGDGLISNRMFNAGDEIGLATIGGIKTAFGRYTNHSIRPNAQYVMHGGDVILEAISPIYNGDEITTNYRTTVQNIARGIE